MNPISELFEGSNSSLFKTWEKATKGGGSERAGLTKFFVDTLRNKQNKPFSAKIIAIKLSHIPTKDLYFVVSVFKDNLKRSGLDKASKEFWWSLKSN